MFHQAYNNFERRARLAYLVLNVFPDMMRDSLLHCMNIKRLFQIYCNDTRNPSILTLTELDLITELPSVANFTIQLCYKFISYEELLPEPSNGWGKFPDKKALALEDDIERIRHVVNEIIAVKASECTQDYFVKYLYKVEPIIKRFQIVLGRTHVIKAYNTLLTQKIDTAEVLNEFENMHYISASDIQHIKLQDRERFSKISIAVTDILPEILRNIIQSGFTPTVMYMLCNNSKKNWTPSEISQINTLKVSDSYKSLDASLLYKLLRMFQFVQNPKQGWGNKPTKYDLSISDDIERIRSLRNKAAHSSNTRVDQCDFNDYFIQFHEIAQRRSMDVDHKLTELETTSLDPQKQISQERALKELEDIKERFEKFPVKYFWGRKFESKIKEIRQRQQVPGIEKIPIVVKLPVSDKAEMRARILNEFKDEINKDTLNIEFLEAVTGSLMIYADINTEIMKTDDSLQLELTSFMTRILHQGRYEIKFTQWMEAVIFLVEGNIEFEIDSSVEKSLSLHFNVNTDVFETDARMESEIGAFMERTIGQLNGNGFNETVTAIIDTCNSEEEHNANELCNSPICEYTSNNTVSLNGSSHIQSCTREDFHFKPAGLSKQAVPLEFIQENISSNDISSKQTYPENRTETFTQYSADMVSSLKEQDNFLRSIILTVEHSKEALQSLLEQHLTNNNQTFEEFLNQDQHEIYHLYYDAKCCQCGPGPLQRKKKMLFASQMELLFDKNRQLSVHKITRRSDFCCCYAKQNVTTAVLDLPLARCLLVNCCIDMFWISCLAFKGVTLEQFLNSNKHILYHLWKGNTKCCKCQPDFIFPCNGPLIMNSEWKKMFSSTLSPCENDRKRPVTGANCICSFTAIPSITVQQIHSELQGIIIHYCCYTRKSVEKLVELKNLTFGHIKKAGMSCTEFNRFMSEAEDAILDIATVCGKNDYYRQRLRDLRDKQLDSRMGGQYEKVLLQKISNYEDIIKENEVLKDEIELLKKSNVEMKEKFDKLCKLQTDGSKR